MNAGLKSKLSADKRSLLSELVIDGKSFGKFATQKYAAINKGFRLEMRRTEVCYTVN